MCSVHHTKHGKKERRFRKNTLQAIFVSNVILYGSTGCWISSQVEDTKCNTLFRWLKVCNLAPQVQIGLIIGYPWTSISIMLQETSTRLWKDINQHTQPDWTLFFLIFTYLWGRYLWSFRLYGSNVASYNFFLL